MTVLPTYSTMKTKLRSDAELRPDMPVGECPPAGAADTSLGHRSGRRIVPRMDSMHKRQASGADIRVQAGIGGVSTGRAFVYAMMNAVGKAGPYP